jgi:hypothetical protein
MEARPMTAANQTVIVRGQAAVAVYLDKLMSVACFRLSAEHVTLQNRESARHGANIRPQTTHALSGSRFRRAASTEQRFEQVAASVFVRGRKGCPQMTHRRCASAAALQPGEQNRSLLMPRWRCWTGTNRSPHFSHLNFDFRRACSCCAAIAAR